MKSSVRGIRKMSMTKIQKELLGALIGLARSVDGRGEAAKGESQEFSSGDSNGHARTKPRMRFCLAEFVRQIRKKS